MGFYDEVRCKYPLPDLEAQNLVFQTKDLECYGGVYTIEEDGSLVEHTFKNMFRTPNYERVDTGDVVIDYHGDIQIYTSIGNKEVSEHLKMGDIYEYTVRFTHGKVEWIRATFSPRENYLTKKKKGDVEL